ncbi:MAG TPA: HNH endonuclease, partial [Ktedonobacteraceae bacterium]|nr:HNH endonuclease [Ktedonobacteraceae bacterium]
TQMNSIRIQLLKRVEAEETWGFVTKEHRLLWDLPKEHVFDAAMIATQGNQPVFHTTRVIVKRGIPEGDYQQTKGKHSEQRGTTGKIMGFRTFDNVRYRGQEYFITGRMATGYASLMDIHGNKVALKPIPKFEKMKRVSARSSWMIGDNVCDDRMKDACGVHPRGFQPRGFLTTLV